VSVDQYDSDTLRTYCNRGAEERELSFAHSGTAASAGATLEADSTEREG
jgi:hypothetical protein